MLVASLTGNSLKYVLGRARPYVSGATKPNDFAIGSGFGNGDRQAFPSGHSYSAFAAAAAVTAETRRWWPQSTWIVAPVMYGGATMVGLSRMYHNQHWVSDVVLGAAIGTFSGLKVVQYSHAHPGNRIDRIMLGTSVVPDPAAGGMRLQWTGTW